MAEMGMSDPLPSMVEAEILEADANAFCMELSRYRKRLPSVNINEV